MAMFDLGKGRCTNRLQETFMRSIILGLAFVAALGAGPAFAAERSGTTTIDIDGRKIVQAFKTSFDPADGTFRTSGTFTLPNGREGAYTLSGTCRRETGSCDLSGSGVGPLGNPWTGTGFAKRTGDKTTVTATLIGPAGRTIRIDREVEGDAILPPSFQLIQPATRR
jgi:hypothetical protein